MQVQSTAPAQWVQGLASSNIDLGKPKDSRQDRYKLLSYARRLLPASRIALCMYAIAESGVRVVQDESGRCGYAGVIRCGNRNACPNCSARAAALDLDRALRAFSSSLDAGYSIFRVTYTIRHDASMPLDYLLTCLGKAQARLHSGRSWQAFKMRWDVGERGYGAEVTHGESAGWHPHRHSAYEVRLPLDLSTVELRKGLAECFKLDLWPLWLAALKSVGLDASWAHGLDVSAFNGSGTAESTARYMTKGARETTQRVSKYGRYKNRSPFQILRAAYEAPSGSERLKARSLFREYVEAIHGRHSVWFSPGWRGLVGETSDEELCADDRGVELLRVSDLQWRAVRFFEAQYMLLAICERDGAAAGYRFLRELVYEGGNGVVRFSRKWMGLKHYEDLVPGTGHRAGPPRRGPRGAASAVGPAPPGEEEEEF